MGLPAEAGRQQAAQAQPDAAAAGSTVPVLVARTPEVRCSCAASLSRQPEDYVLQLQISCRLACRQVLQQS